MKELDLLADLQRDVAATMKEMPGVFDISPDKVHVSEELFKELFTVYTVNKQNKDHMFLEQYYDGVRFFALLEEEDEN